MKLLSLLILACTFLSVESFCIISPSTRHGGETPPFLIRSQPRNCPINDVSLRFSRNQSTLYGTKKNKNDRQTEVSEDKISWIDIVKQKPGTLVIAPFVLIFFLDIVANVLVLTKRTMEYAFTGQYTVWHL
jgi:hypothetical protein